VQELTTKIDFLEYKKEGLEMKRIDELKKQLETIYKTTTKAYRQKSAMSKKINYICNQIMIEEGKKCKI
jgi:hypothetical protein